MTLKSLIFLFPLFFLGACSTLPNSETTPTERTEPRVRTLADVYAYVVRIAALDPERLNIENIAAITDTPLHQRGGHYDADFVIDESLSIHMQLAQHGKDNLSFFVEFVPTLPFPKEFDQKIVNDYMERLAKFQPRVIQTHCISKENLFNTLFKNGWAPVETNLSTLPSEDEGNFDFSSKDGRYVTLTIGGNCLEQFTISTTQYPAVLGIPKSKN